jgi:alkanesulfonate monooxygenase SsuD/methylene tetrahydromethanopterin reductase-like flavin-dependent oxidoreductase (luciferase family)
MKLGIFLLGERYSATATLAIHNDIEMACYAEELGFDEVWFAEHHCNNFSVIPNPSLIMACTVAKTKTIRVGSAAFLAPFYHPTRLAEEIATLDNLSFGRINAGFAKGGFTLDIQNFEKSPESLRAEMFANIKSIETKLYEEAMFEPKPIQKKVPFYIATFSTHETITFAAKNGYGLMFSQGATLEECELAQELYKSIAGVYPQVILMRVFSMASDSKVAYERAVVATDHFVKSMRAVQSKQEQPSFNKRNYDALLTQRYEFFDAQKFMKVALIGNEEEIVEQISNIQRRIHHLHLVLKVGATDTRVARIMLHKFMQKIKPKLQKDKE